MTAFLVLGPMALRQQLSLFLLLSEYLKVQVLLKLDSDFITITGAFYPRTSNSSMGEKD